MSRSGYTEDFGDSDLCWLYMGPLRRATNGRRGQAFLRELRNTLEAMPEKRLIAHDLQVADGSVCAIGAVGQARGVDMAQLDPEDPEAVARAFGIAPSLAREIVFTNDDDFGQRGPETPEQRYERVLSWVRGSIIPHADENQPRPPGGVN